MNIAEALSLRGEPDSYERQENVWLLEHLLQLSALQMKYQATQCLSSTQEQAYLAGLKRLAAGEPLAYITGNQPFWTLDLKVTPDTLVPRPDTEVLVEKALSLSLQGNAKVLDLGTGTGAIALSLASERPEWKVVASDIYAPTLEVAQYNAEQHDIENVEFLLGSWLKPFGRQFFDVIASNPPYIDANDVHMKDLATEPERALVAAKNGLADLEDIILQAKKHLTVNGWVVLEHGYDQADKVQHLFRQAGYKQVRTVKDYGGNDRVTLACWPH